MSYSKTSYTSYYKHCRLLSERETQRNALAQPCMTKQAPIKARTSHSNSTKSFANVKSFFIRGGKMGKSQMVSF